MKIESNLISKCVQKDRASQRALYEILLPYLNAVCRRYLYNQSDVKDVLQESFVSIFSNIEKYDAKRSQFQTWAVKITINTCLKLNAKMSKMPLTEFENVDVNYEDPTVIGKLSNEDLISLLKTLPMEFFNVFNLFVIEGYSHKEIGEMLVIDITLSRKRLSRAKALLRKKLEGNKPEVLDKININDL